MGDRNRKIILFLTTVTDLFMVVVAWALAFYIRFHSLIPVSKGIPEILMYYKMIPFILMTWFVAFTFSGLYTRTGSHRSAVTEGFDILQNCAFATLAFISVTFFYDEYRYSRLTLMIFALLHPVLILTGRSLLRKSVRYYRRNSSSRRILIIGSGKPFLQALAVAKDSFLETAEVKSAIIVGSCESAEESRTCCNEKRISELPVPENWAKFFTENPCESVVLALPYDSYEFLEEHLEQITEQVIDIKILPDLYKYTRLAAGIEMVNQTPVINIHASPLEGAGVFLKRAVDIIGAMVAMLIFGPVMLGIAMLVRISSRGPVFYRQQRMGLDGKVFSILKFRSMPVDSESRSGAVWATSADSRATPLGSFLRKSSLDELPQLFNVLRGDMSLVGPRPERPVFVNRFRHDVPGYMLRHKVKAGMTGWAQINGWRGNTSIDKRIECDLYYIQNWSLWLDIKILFMTVFRGFISPNAY